MADKHRKKTEQDKLEQQIAMAEKLAREERRKRIVMTVFVVVLCLALVVSFCLPTLSWLIA